MTFKHPDFAQEQVHLEDTKQYMEQILIRSKADIEAAKENIQTSLSNVEYLDSSDSFVNILTNMRFFELARDQKEGLEAIRKKPYFARIHFQRDGEAEELLYIGKTSLFHSETHEPIIVDWRSPVANVYYDGRLGELTYDVRGDELSGQLFAKRQYKIENGELLDIRDVDLTTNDELLQEALEGKADVRLTEIVSTIQKEQNEIIRAHLKQPIVVQGAAGSGKTTIALHRISYFLYTMGDHFKPEQLMILAPNNLFIEYIGDVLPELGVDRICQTTYGDYVQNATKLKLKLADSTAILEELVVSNGKSLPDFNILKLKGTLFYKEVMDRILNVEEQRIASLFTDVFIEKYRIMRGSNLKKLFTVDFAYMPIEKRLERIKKVIQTEVKRKTKAVMTTLKNRYDEAIERALNGMRDAEKRRRVVTKFLDERDERLPKIEQEAKTTTSKYMRMFPKLKVKALYREILTNRELLHKIVPEWDFIQVEQFLTMHAKEIWTNEDLAAIYYLTAKIKGIEDPWKMRVVFIDEVQDYSLFQLAALKEGLETDMFTMVGDLAQGIHSYRSLTEWQPVLDLFPRATYATLQKSYRTTIEIMDLANRILMQMDEDLPLVEPVVRHGREPEFVMSEEFDARLVAKHFEDLAMRHKSIAFICKTSEEAARAAKELSAFLHVQLLEPGSSLDADANLLVVPSHLAKGLEFDAVIIGIVDTPYHSYAIDRKLLYVALTRAMHELVLIGPNEEAFLVG